MSEHIQGVGVSPGIAIGRVHLLHGEDLPVVPVPVPPERVDEEVALFHDARDLARREIEDLRDRIRGVLGTHYAGILDAQLLILEDPGLVGETARQIRVGRVTARWALKEVVGQFARRFEELDSAYLRERGGDLADVHHRLQRLLVGRDSQERELPEGPLVIVARHVAPSDAVALAGKGVVGLATDVGGRTSHTAILAQALSVPAVAGLHDVSRRVRQGDPIVIDGSTGEVELRADSAGVHRAEERRESFLAREREAMTPEGHVPAVTRDGVQITLRANIEFAHEVDTAQRFGAQGIGLYRSEFLFVSHSPGLPDEEDHYRTYRDIATRVAPHPAVIRTLDLGGEKYFHEVLDRDEPNPVLGLRGVRLCLKRPDIFRPQLRGLLRAAVEPNLSIMLPLVTTPDEIREVRRLIADEAGKLRGRGVEVREDVPVGIMIEVPGAALSADLLARESDFFSLGTNDLIQYALAVDRGNESVSYLYQPQHTGVLRMIRSVVVSAERAGIDLATCGEMAADPESLAVLIGMGLREFSVQPRAVAPVRSHVRNLHAGEAALKVEALLRGEGQGEPGSSEGGTLIGGERANVASPDRTVD